MDKYAQFSVFYDRLMGDRSDVIRIINNCVHRHFPAATSLLELGSGSGAILRGLAPFYDVEGLDISSKMLQLSQQKLPSVMHHLADMSSFDNGKSYDVIICVFDSINHLLKPEQWQSTFECVKRALNPGGLFVFDTLTIGRLTAETKLPTYHEDVTGGHATMTTSFVSAGRVQHLVTFEEASSDGATQVYEQTVDEVAFPLKDVESWLTKHFGIVDRFGNDDYPVSDNTGRVYYVCRSRGQ